MRIFKFLIYYVIFSIGSLSLCAESDEWRLMVYQFAEKSIAEQYSLSLYLEEGFFGMAENKEYFMPDFGLKYYTLNKYLPSLSLHYRENYIKKSSHDWIKEIRPYIRFNFKLPKIRNMNIFNNLRFEYRKFDVWEDWRIRNIIHVFLPFKLTPLELIPYLGDEIRYSCEKDKVASNEFLIGAFYKITNNIKLEVFYRGGHYRKDDSWNNTNIYGVGLSWKA